MARSMHWRDFKIDVSVKRIGVRFRALACIGRTHPTMAGTCGEAVATSPKKAVAAALRDLIVARGLRGAS